MGNGIIVVFHGIDVGTGFMIIVLHGTRYA